MASLLLGVCYSLVLYAASIDHAQLKALVDSTLTTKTERHHPMSTSEDMRESLSHTYEAPRERPPPEPPPREDPEGPTISHNNVCVEEHPRGPPPPPPPPPLPPAPPDNQTGFSRKKRKGSQEHKPSPFKIGSVNVNGLTRKKEAKLEAILLSRDFDMMAIQEVKAHSQWSPLSVVAVPFAKPFPRIGMRGLLILVAPRHKDRTLRIDTGNNHVQAILFQLRPMPVVVLNVYSPPRDAPTAAEVANEISRLSELYASNAHFFVCGDFNVDLTKDSKRETRHCHKSFSDLRKLEALTICSPLHPGHYTRAQGGLHSNIDSILTRLPAPPTTAGSSWEGIRGENGDRCMSDNKLITVVANIAQEHQPGRWEAKLDLGHFRRNPRPFIEALNVNAKRWRGSVARARVKILSGAHDTEPIIRALWVELLDCFREAARKECRPHMVKVALTPRPPRWARADPAAVRAAGIALPSLPPSQREDVSTKESEEALRNNLTNTQTKFYSIQARRTKQRRGT